MNNSILKRHIQAIHNDQKRFQCTACGKCLASRQNLKEHMFIHTGEKPYRCLVEGCGASFRQGTHLSAHKKNEHGFGEIENFSQRQKYIIDLGFLTRLITNIKDTVELQPTSKFEDITLRLIDGICNTTIPNIFF